jgi:hypothetical protein
MILLGATNIEHRAVRAVGDSALYSVDIVWIKKIVKNNEKNS